MFQPSGSGALIPKLASRRYVEGLGWRTNVKGAYAELGVQSIKVGIGGSRILGRRSSFCATINTRSSKFKVSTLFVRVHRVLLYRYTKLSNFSSCIQWSWSATSFIFKNRQAPGTDRCEILIRHIYHSPLRFARVSLHFFSFLVRIFSRSHSLYLSSIFFFFVVFFTLLYI